MTTHKPAGTGESRYPPNDQVRLESLDGWSLPRGLDDPRGLDVMTTDGRKMGTIDGLLGSPATGRADFVIVDNGSRISPHAWPMPLSMITVQDGVAHVPVTHNRFADAPNWKTSAPNYQLICNFWYGGPLPESDDEFVPGEM